jgi:catechol-2,3-dioxygenase
MLPFKINFLDHVAIRVRDLEVSATWYESMFGLKRYQPEEWGAFPIFMLAGNSGIALFPANASDIELDPTSRNVKIDHFAFNVSREDLEKAMAHYTEHGIPFQFQDHHYFHSIYLKDPDGHTAEMTALVGNV